MTQDLRDFVPTSCDLLALGEPTHQEPAFAQVRNELFVQLADRGFRSFAIESDRVAALAVNDFVQDGACTLDSAMKDGFSHGFGDLDANRQLVAWMREYNESRPAHERLSFHGFDAVMETMSAPSPRPYLEHARDYLGLDLDIAGLVGDDERWSRMEAVMDPAMSPGATAEADRLRVIADDMRTALYAKAPVLIAATSRAEWYRADTHLTAGIGLLRYHRQSAQRMERDTRIAHLFNLRDVLMAQNLLTIRDVEARRGATLVFSHNTHLRRTWSDNGDRTWFGAGAIIGSLLGERFTVVVGSLGRSPAIGLEEPDPNTYEGGLQRGIATWGLVAATAVAPGGTRTDTTPRQGYFPLDQTTLDGADAVLHINSGG
ncbi:MAG: erythromycin esterase family protein [Actinophytocola sp.]|uniref:erythromycin esterase family protein n=1 Tax=Actinophytocola sp. TaxID=1872138 RepID=UPI003C7798E9